MTQSAPLWAVRLGTVPYAEAVALQEQLRVARGEGRVPDLLLLLQHPPVITLGRGADDRHLLASPDALQGLGFEVHESARGGDVTYHGPGQLVGYPIVHLDPLGRDVHRYVRGVEEALIRTLATYGIEAGREKGLTGVWVGAQKVAAIGVSVRRWVTWHGFALNVNTHLEHFRHIIPCGIQDRGVTSLQQLIGREVPLDEVEERATQAFAEVFGLSPIWMTREEVVVAAAELVATEAMPATPLQGGSGNLQG